VRFGLFRSGDLIRNKQTNLESLTLMIKTSTTAIIYDMDINKKQKLMED